MTSTIAPDMLHAPLDRAAIASLLERLPEPTTYAQAIDALLVHAAIAQGEAEVAAGLTAPHEDVVRRLHEKIARRDGRPA